MIIFHAGFYDSQLHLWGEAPPKSTVTTRRTARFHRRNRCPSYDAGPEALIAPLVEVVSDLEIDARDTSRSDHLASRGEWTARRLQPADCRTPKVQSQGDHRCMDGHDLADVDSGCNQSALSHPGKRHSCCGRDRGRRFGVLGDRDAVCRHVGSAPAVSTDAGSRQRVLSRPMGANHCRRRCASGLAACQRDAARLPRDDWNQRLNRARHSRCDRAARVYQRGSRLPGARRMQRDDARK